MFRGYLISVTLGILSLILVISFVLFPDEVFQSSLRGLKIWWDVVFPALLPFFIVSEFLMGFGLAHFFGVLLEPVMRPLFKVPGTGAFVLTMGFASGYPMGSKLTVQLREQNLLSRSEGERLVSFTSTSDPLFMFGAVAVGFFHDVALGIILVVVHYVSSILLGILMRFHDPKGKITDYSPSGRFILFRAIEAMHNARIRDGRPIGKLMGDAVSSSINTLLLVGGLIIIFSVLMKLFVLLKISVVLGKLFGIILFVFGVPLDLSTSLINGLFEVTIGAQSAAQDSGSTAMIDKIAIAGAILAWSGLSVQAQVASIISKTDIRFYPYFISRIIHAFLAAGLTYVIWKPAQKIIHAAALPTFLQYVPISDSIQYWQTSFLMGIRFIFLFCILILTSILVIFVQLVYKTLQKKY